MKITSSVEWNKVSDDLRRKTFSIKTSENRFQIKQMIRNIDSKVSELSKAEVIARQGRSNLSEALLNNVNDDIDLVEGYIIVAALIG